MEDNLTIDQALKQADAGLAEMGAENRYRELSAELRDQIHAAERDVAADKAVEGAD